MAVPSSGELQLRGDIALEVYGTATGSNISLGAMSDLAGFPAPDAMSDFYGYTGVEPPSIIELYSSSTDSSVYARIRLGPTGGENPYSTGVYIGTSTNMTSNPKYELGAGSAYQYKGYNRTGLAANTTYYWWGYATNSAGTTYTARQTRATGASYSYSTNSKYAYMNSSSQAWSYYAFGRPSTATRTYQYNHVYNGWTTTDYGTGSTNDSLSVNSTNYANSSVYMYATTGLDTQNRMYITIAHSNMNTAEQQGYGEPYIELYSQPGGRYQSSYDIGWVYYDNSSYPAAARYNQDRSFSTSGNTSNAGYSEDNTGSGLYGYLLYSGRSSYFWNIPYSSNISLTRYMYQTSYNLA
jgi:hypothetical protein